jgi:hypothetical protein
MDMVACFPLVKELIAGSIILRKRAFAHGTSTAMYGLLSARVDPARPHQPVLIGQHDELRAVACPSFTIARLWAGPRGDSGFRVAARLPLGGGV